jgi:predicted extracellular nuclease
MVLSKLSLKRLFSLVAIFFFSIALVACGNNEAELEARALLEEAKTSLIIADMSNIVNNIDLNTEGRNDVAITWVSDKPEYISNTGSVTRPAFAVGDQTVKITATLTIQYTAGNKTETITDTKEFTLRVRALPDTTLATIAQVRASALDSNVETEGIVTAKFNSGFSGFFITDATGGIFVFSSHASVALGDLVRITGKRQAYFGAPQIAGTVGIVKVSSNNALPAPTPKAVSAIANEPIASAAIQGDLNLVEGKLIQKTEGANKNYYIQDPFTAQEIQIYYRTYEPDTTANPNASGLNAFIV